MKKYILSLALLISCHVFAQKAGKAAYAELGGAGLASLNYDMRIMKKNDGLGFRVGIGGFSIKANYGGGSYDKESIITVPLELNYLLGKDEKHYFEIGGGATIVNSKYKSSDPQYSYYSNENFHSTFGHLYFGYRIQPANGGFLFRAGITPVFGQGYFIPYWAGVSFGYKF